MIFQDRHLHLQLHVASVDPDGRFAKLQLLSGGMNYEPLHTAQLVDGGFMRAGRLAIRRGTESIRFMGNNQLPLEPGVYAYVVAGVVHYIGSAQLGLRQRLRHYEIAKTLRTAQHIRKEVVALLQEGRAVDVYTIVPLPMTVNGLLVDMVAGLEEGLIRSLRPSWNQRSMGATMLNHRKGTHMRIEE